MAVTDQMQSRPTYRRPATLALALVLSLVLGTGCAKPGTEQDFERYLSRLANTLGETVPEPGPEPRMATPPRPGQLMIELPGSTLDTLDFLALTGCEVQVTIGKRNSSLGRMASESQRLLLDLEYLQLAPDCLRHLRSRGSETLADTLEAAWQQKREQLPARIFNATLGNQEYRSLWQRPPGLGDYPAQAGSLAPSALAAVNLSVASWLAGDYRFDNREFELLLGEVATGDGGALAMALAMQAAALARADAIVEARLGRRPLCLAGLRPEAADILDNVVRKFFVGGVQTWSAAVGRRRHELLPPIVTLETMLEQALPASYRDWQVRRDAALEDWAGSPRRHVGRLQQLRASCESLPTPGN